mmetsp:Transcript_95098/g.266274  ORF Transcript_95098/g.266274 Transcript_95098/m.266274 type:complete len:235 (+) Transcript_95098:244-948(+)
MAATTFCAAIDCNSAHAPGIWSSNESKWASLIERPQLLKESCHGSSQVRAARTSQIRARHIGSDGFSQTDRLLGLAVKAICSRREKLVQATRSRLRVCCANSPSARVNLIRSHSSDIANCNSKTSSGPQHDSTNACLAVSMSSPSSTMLSDGICKSTGLGTFASDWRYAKRVSRMLSGVRSSCGTLMPRPERLESAPANAAAKLPACSAQSNSLSSLDLQAGVFCFLANVHPAR